jgi:sugar lactone lactonase YvrE
MVVLFLTACVFVSCTKTDVNAIPGKYDPNGKAPGSTGSGTTTGGTGTTNSDSTSTSLFSSPDDVAVDAAGNLYVADYGNNLIRKITTAGVVTTLAGNGTIGANNGPGATASFSGPSGVAVDNAGNVYVADAGNNLIRKIAPDGTVSTLAGTVAAVDTSNTVTSEPLFSSPSGVAVDASGNVYVADAGNNEIRVVSPAGVVNTLAGNLNAGGSDGTGGNATFNNPTGVAVDGSGNVYVADLLNNLIRKITPGGVVTTIAGSGSTGSNDGVGALASFYFPNSLAVDASGNLYVTDALNNLIRKVATDGTVSTIAGNGTAGFLNGTGTATSFNDPAGVTVDGTGNLFVADANNNLIRKITPAGQVTTVAGTIPAVSVIRNTVHNLYHVGLRKLASRLSLGNKSR